MFQNHTIVTLMISFLHIFWQFIMLSYPVISVFLHMPSTLNRRVALIWLYRLLYWFKRRLSAWVTSGCCESRDVGHVWVESLCGCANQKAERGCLSRKVLLCTRVISLCRALFSPLQSHEPRHRQRKAQCHFWRRNADQHLGRGAGKDQEEARNRWVGKVPFASRHTTFKIRLSTCNLTLYSS